MSIKLTESATKIHHEPEGQAVQFVVFVKIHVKLCILNYTWISMWLFVNDIHEDVTRQLFINT